MSAKKEVKNPLQKYIDEINSLDVLKHDDTSKDLTSDSKLVKSKIVNLSHITKAKENLFLLMEELKLKKKIS